MALLTVDQLINGVTSQQESPKVKVGISTSPTDDNHKVTIEGDPFHVQNIINGSSVAPPQQINTSVAPPQQLSGPQIPTTMGPTNIGAPQQYAQAPGTGINTIAPDKSVLDNLLRSADPAHTLTDEEKLTINQHMEDGHPETQMLGVEAANKRQAAIEDRAHNDFMNSLGSDTQEQRLNLAEGAKSVGSKAFNFAMAAIFGRNSDFAHEFAKQMGVGAKYSAPGNYEVTIGGKTQIIPNVQAQATADGLLTGKYLVNGKEIAIPPGATVRSISPSQKVVDQLADAGYVKEAEEYSRTGKLPPGFYLPKEAIVALFNDDSGAALALMRGGAGGVNGTGETGALNFHSKASRAKAAEVSTKLLDNVDISKDGDAAAIYRVLSNPNALSSTDLSKAIQAGATIVSKNKLGEEQRKQIQELEKLTKGSELRKSEKVFEAEVERKYGPDTAAAKKSAEVTAEATANGYDVSPGHEPLWKQKADRTADAESQREAIKEATRVYSTKSDIESQIKSIDKSLNYLETGEHNIGPILSTVVGRGRIAQAVGGQFQTEQNKNTKLIMDAVNKLVVVGLKQLGPNPSNADREFWTKTKPDEYSSPEFVKEWILDHKKALERNLTFAEDTLKNRGKFPGTESTDKFVIKSVKPL